MCVRAWCVCLVSLHVYLNIAGHMQAAGGFLEPSWAVSLIEQPKQTKTTPKNEITIYAFLLYSHKSFIHLIIEMLLYTKKTLKMRSFALNN